MPTIFITSGTSWIAPPDFNPNNNTIECYGGGSDGGVTTAGAGGGGAAYAKTTNLNISPGVTVNIHIGALGARDTYFNATSLANAVSNGTAVSCGAQGATGTAGGLASSSCGTTKFNGGNGGTSNNNTCGGGGGGGAAGPNGAGAAGGNSPNDAGGGGGGGANGGAAGTSGTAGNNQGHGGNGRLGTGGGAFNGGSGAVNSGGGGGPGYPTAGKGALDNVYGDSVHGPGGGGGGGAANFASYPGGDAGGFGGGGGGGSTYDSIATAAPGQSTDGLIVITYTPVPPVFSWQSAKNLFGFRPRPVLQQALPVERPSVLPILNLGFYTQPIALQHPPSWTLFAPWGQLAQPWPNPTPLFKNPWPQPPDLLRHPPTLDTRQQFPGKAPADFHVAATEGADVLSATGQQFNYSNATIPEADTILSFVIPTPIRGSADDVIRRVKSLLPKRWWSFVAPIRDAIIGGIADLTEWSFSLITYAKLQSRVAWATGIWLDIIAKDYFGTFIRRKSNESDDRFRARIQKELIRERVTRAGMIQAVEDLTGLPAVIFEPWNTGDTGAWDNGTFALDIAGGWGDYLAAQSFLNVTPPGIQGITGVGGWDTGYLAWDGGIGMWVDTSLIVGSVTTQDIYDTINATRPTGSIVWTQLFPPALPIPIPPAPTLTPSIEPPGLRTLPVVRPNPAAYSIPVMPDDLGLL